MNAGTIILIIFIILIIIAIVILFVLIFTGRDVILSNGVPYFPIQGASTDTSFIGGGNNIYLVARGVTTLQINAPNYNPTNRIFMVSNVNNTSTLALTAVSGLTLIGGSVLAGENGIFLWLNTTTIQQIQ